MYRLVLINFYKFMFYFRSSENKDKIVELILQIFFRKIYLKNIL